MKEYTKGRIVYTNNIRKEIDKIIALEKRDRPGLLQFLDLERIPDITWGNCETYALANLNLDCHKEGFEDFEKDMGSKGIFDYYRLIDFLFLEKHIKQIDEVQDSALIAYWSSDKSQAVCSTSGLPEYLHYGVSKMEGSELVFVSKWGWCGQVYQTKSILHLPTTYGDRIHIFQSSL